MASDASKPTECKSCITRREETGGKHRVRMITRLPIEVTQTVDFRKKGKPVYLCEYCDGDALGLALREGRSADPEIPED